MKKALTIAGSDCSGGAGIEADLKTFAAHGVYGMSVITSVVAENTCRVLGSQNIEPELIEKQIEAVFEDIEPDAVKIGMLPDRECMQAAGQKLREYHAKNIVIDPVMIAKGGCALMRPDAVETFKSDILPLAFLLTPNIPEAETLTGIKIESVCDMERAAEKMIQMGAQNVLVKGGHAQGDAIDVLFDGNRFYHYSSERIQTKNTHGTGCTYSSAIAANLALGQSLPDAVKRAKDYITMAIGYSLNIGKEHGPLNHFYGYINGSSKGESK